MIRTKHLASNSIESSAIIPRNDSLGKYLLTEPVNRNTMTPVAAEGTACFHSVGEPWQRTGCSHSVGGCSKVDGVARERLLIFDTEADSEVLR